MKKIFMLLLIVLTFGASVAAGNILLEENYFDNLISNFKTVSFETNEEKEAFFTDSKYLGGRFFETENLEDTMVIIEYEGDLNYKMIYIFDQSNSINGYYEKTTGSTIETENETTVLEEDKEIYLDVENSILYTYKLENEKYTVEKNEDQNEILIQYNSICTSYNLMSMILNKESFDLNNLSITKVDKNVYNLKVTADDAVVLDLKINLKNNTIEQTNENAKVTITFTKKDLSFLPKVEASEVTE